MLHLWWGEPMLMMRVHRLLLHHQHVHLLHQHLLLEGCRVLHHWHHPQVWHHRIQHLYLLF
jgi:hypothetical protein